MLRLYLLISCTLLLVCFSARSTPQAQVTKERVYLRPSIETYTAAEKRLFLPYLNEAKAAADKGMKMLAEGQIDALYEAMIPELRKQGTIEQFREAMKALEQTEGKVASYEYRNQALIFPDDGSSMSEMQKAQSQVWYAVKTSTSKSQGLFLIVKTSRVGTQHFVNRFKFSDYGENIPPWLKYPNAPANAK